MDGRSGEAADHEAEVASVGNGGHGGGCDDDGDVGRENPYGFEESRWETADGADGDGCDGDDRLLATAAIDMSGEETEDWSGDGDSDGPGY